MFPHKGWLSRSLALISLLLPAIMVVAQPAVAEQPANNGQTTTVSSPMQVLGFNADVAAAHGYEIRTDAMGRQYSVKVGTKGAVSPNSTDVLTGNCGFSYITFTSIGNHKANMQTGFGVNGSAVYYSWNVSVFNPLGTYWYGWGGGLLFRSTWESGITTYYTPFTGFTYAQVSTSSYATLSNGALCYSMGPITSDWVY